MKACQSKSARKKKKFKGEGRKKDKTFPTI